jgi:hypothetical protein|tara:strand:- start:3533 stop:5971 length:2439 start_codon:yes stop_codon:yes gene_type:complete
MKIRSLGKGLNLPQWLAWMSLSVLACVALAYVILHYADYLAKQWAEAALSEHGIESEIDIRWVGLSGADIESIALRGEGFDALAEDVSMRWRPLELADDRLDSVEIGQLSMAFDLSAESYFSRLNKTPKGPRLSLRTIHGSFLPVDFSPSVVLPESGWLEQWWAFPLDRLLAHNVEVGIDFGDHSMGMDIELDLSTVDDRRRLSTMGSGVDFDFQFLLNDESSTPKWQTQLSWSGRHLLDVWEQILPAQHEYSVETRLGQWLDDWEASTLELEALVEGEGSDISAYSVLLEQGPFWARSEKGIEFQTNGLSAGVTQEDNRIKQAEVVVDFEYISFLGGQTRPMKASVSGVDGNPLHIEMPSVRWSRAGEMEVDFAMRAFLNPEDKTAEIQLSVLKAAWGKWSVKPFRWFMSQSAGALSGRLSAIAIERFPDWMLANARFDESQEGVYTYSADLEFVSESLRLLSLNGSLNNHSDASFACAAEIRDTDGLLIGSIESQMDDAGLEFEGGGQYSLDQLRQHLRPLYSDAESVVAEGKLEWSVAGKPHRFFPFQAEVGLKFDDLNVRLGKGNWHLSGLSSALSFRAVGPFPASSGVQEIRIGKITSGQDAIDDVLIQFDWLTRDQLKVLKIEGNWMGGKISIAPFELNLREPLIIHSVLRFDGIEAGRLLEDAGQIGFSLDARLHGSVPISYALGSQPKLNKGTLSLQSIDDAKPILQDSLKIAGLLGLPDIANIRARIAKAIESDFRIYSLEVSLFDAAFPGQPIRAVLVGSVVNEDVEIPHFEIVQSHRVDSALKGWQSLLFFFSGGTWAPPE